MFSVRVVLTAVVHLDSIDTLIVYLDVRMLYNQT